MKKLHRTGLALFATLLFAASAWAGAGPAGHHDDTFSSGEPGDAKKPARIVQVTMAEADGKMTFTPNKIEVKRGDQIRFMLRNNGELEHEFILATTAENLKHAEAMKKESGHGTRCSERQAARAEENRRDHLEVQQSRRVRILMPDPRHREAGMIGTVTVN